MIYRSLQWRHARCHWFFGGDTDEGKLLDFVWCRTCHCARKVEDLTEQTSDEKSTPKGPHLLHEPTDLRAGKKIPVPEIPLASRQRRTLRIAEPLERASYNMVPESTCKVEEGYWGDEERSCSDENFAHARQVSGVSLQQVYGL